MLITFNYKDGTQTVRFQDTLTADGWKEKVRICPVLLTTVFSRETEELFFVISGTFANKQSRSLLEDCGSVLYCFICPRAEFASFSSRGLRYWPGKAARHLGHLLRRTLGDDRGRRHRRPRGPGR